MVKKFNGANWADTSVNRRWNGSAWVDCSSIKRWDGANWVECLKLPIPTQAEFRENFASWEAHTVASINKDKISATLTKSGFELMMAEPNTSAEIHMQLYAVMKNGRKILIEPETTNALNARIRIHLAGYVCIINGTNQRIKIGNSEIPLKNVVHSNGRYDFDWAFWKGDLVDFSFYMQSGAHCSSISGIPFSAGVYYVGDSYLYHNLPINPYF